MLFHQLCQVSAIERAEDHFDMGAHNMSISWLWCMFHFIGHELAVKAIKISEFSFQSYLGLSHKVLNKKEFNING